MDRADEPLLRDGMGAWTLEELVDVLGRVGVVVASSTGPLHIASALGTSVVGLYRSDAPFWPQRWAPLGPSKVLSTNAHVAQWRAWTLSVEEVHAAVHDILASTMELKSARHAKANEQRQEGQNRPGLGLKGVFEPTTQGEHEPAPKGVFVVRHALDFSQTSQKASHRIMPMNPVEMPHVRCCMCDLCRCPSANLDSRRVRRHFPWRRRVSHAMAKPRRIKPSMPSRFPMFHALKQGVSSWIAACKPNLPLPFEFAQPQQQSSLRRVMCGSRLDGCDITFRELEDVLAIFGPTQ